MRRRSGIFWHWKRKYMLLVTEKAEHSYTSKIDTNGGNSTVLIVEYEEKFSKYNVGTSTV